MSITINVPIAIYDLW